MDNDQISTTEKSAKGRRTLRMITSVGDGAGATPPVRWGLAVSVGIAGAFLNALSIGHVSLYLGGSGLGVDYLPIGVFCLFILLIALNGLLRRFGLGLRRSELVVAYVTMLVTAGIPQSGFAGRFVPSLTYVYHYATSQNEYAAMFHPYLPSWFGPSDPETISQFYSGTDGGPIPWGAWFAPLAVWLIPWFGMVLLMGSIGLLLRQRWVVDERLTFPLAQIPLAVLGEEEIPTFNKTLFGDWIFWVAAGIPFSLRFLEGLHFFYPAVPYLKLGSFGVVRDIFSIQDPGLGELFNTTFIEIHLALIGVAILMRADVSASFWGFQLGTLFFGWVMILFGIGQGELAYTAHWQFGYSMFIRFGRLGASLAAVIYMVWSARTQLSRAWYLLLHPGEETKPGDEGLRWCYVGIAGGAAIYLGWALGSGMGADTALTMLVCQVLVIVILARIIADGGMFWSSLSLDPMINTAIITGTEHMSPRTVTMMVMSNQMPMAPRGNILPSIMDGFKLGSVVKVKPGKLLGSMYISIALVSVLSLAIILYLAYTHGATYLDVGTFKNTAGWPWFTAPNYLLYPGGPNTSALLTVGMGAGLMTLFIWMYRSFRWWPLYPFGFAIAESATMEMLWMSVLIGWTIRQVVLRLGGAAGYRRIKPAAIGVVVGDFVAIGMWALIDALTGTIAHQMNHGVSTW